MKIIQTLQEIRAALVQMGRELQRQEDRGYRPACLLAPDDLTKIDTLIEELSRFRPGGSTVPADEPGRATDTACRAALAAAPAREKAIEALEVRADIAHDAVPASPASNPLIEALTLIRDRALKSNRDSWMDDHAAIHSIAFSALRGPLEPSARALRGSVPSPPERGWRDMSGDIGIGDVLPIRNMRVIIQDGRGWLDFKSAKGECFVVMLLGKQDVAANGQKLDPVKVLNALGWEPVGPLSEDSET